MNKVVCGLVALMIVLGLAVGGYSQTDLEDEDMLVGRPAKFQDGVFGVYFDRGNRAKR